MPRHVYVHVPFCSRRCSYCDFSIAVRRVVPVGEYLAALRAELHVRFGAGAFAEVDTLYFGGGTPSRLGGAGLANAVALVRERFPLAPDAEVTAEVNPEDVSAAAVGAWRAAGISRLSIGSQSFDDRALAWMHRTHDAGAIARSVEIARGEGIDNLSLDLIFALPESLERRFDVDLARVIALHPQHVSLYGLTVEAGTPLGRWVARGTATESPEEHYERDFLQADEALAGAGYEHYEVSNYARAGARSRHNSSYWSGAAYVGLGPAAHGFDGSGRRWNARHYADWRDRALAGGDPMDGAEELTPDNRVAEAVYLGLRTVDGLALAASERELVAPWMEAGWVRLDVDGRLRCTPAGWLRLDSLATALTHHRSR